MQDKAIVISELTTGEKVAVGICTVSILISGYLLFIMAWASQQPIN